jgi:hypothetical protein
MTYPFGRRERILYYYAHTRVVGSIHLIHSNTHQVHTPSVHHKEKRPVHTDRSIVYTRTHGLRFVSSFLTILRAPPTRLLRGPRASPPTLPSPLFSSAASLAPATGRRLAGENPALSLAMRSTIAQQT